MNKFRMYQKGFSVQTIHTMYHRPIPEIDFSDDMQRGEVWNNVKKSLYIHSILLKITDAQSPFIAGVRELSNGEQLFKIFDGKQRGTTLIHFLDGDFALTGLKNEPDIVVDGEIVKLQGKRFGQLPQRLKDIIKDTNINFSILENATTEQEALIFRRLNNGKNMSKFDIARSYKPNMDDIKVLKDHELFNVMLSDTDRLALKQQEIIVKTWIALFENEPSFTPAHVNETMASLNVSPDEQTQIKDYYDLIFEAYKILNVDEDNAPIIKLIFKPTHFLGFISYLDRFESAKQLAQWIEKFFANPSMEYVSLVREHTTSPSSIKARQEIIKKSIDEFLGK